MAIVRWREWFRPRPLPLGIAGERYAAKWLKKKGYRILGQGLRSRLGELDLVAKEGATLVFVEVKTRRSSSRGEPVEAVGLQKQQRLVRAALQYMTKHRLLGVPCRFDVVSIVWPEDVADPELKHYKAAFDAAGHPSMYS